MLSKIVYFDESSVTDFMQIVAGGQLEKTTELLNQSMKNASSEANIKGGGGFGGIVKALIGLEAEASAGISGKVSFNSNRMVKNIVKNTILTDFIDFINKNSSEESDKSYQNIVKKFTGYAISTPQESLSYVALISPYFAMLKNGTSVPAGEFNIAVDKLDNAMKNAKGYYEFVGEMENSKAIFRFNINAFKNNYKAPDLLKMDIAIYAIKVGRSSLAKLNVNNEFELDKNISLKDNPEYVKEGSKNIPDEYYNELDMYDVLLAGVEIND